MTKKLLLRLLLIGAVSATCGCGTATKVSAPVGSKTLSGKSVCLVIELAGGSVTTSGMSIESLGGYGSANSAEMVFAGATSGLSVSHSMDGQNQAVMAAKALEMELQMMGARMVKTPKDADVIAAFYIGECRYDPLAGWIADNSFIDFRDSKTGNSIAMIRGDGRFITPTIKSHIRRLSDSIKTLL